MISHHSTATRLLLSFALLTLIAACTDDYALLAPPTPSGRTATEVINFTTTVSEQADLLVEMGRTRSGSFKTDSLLLAANSNGVHPLQDAPTVQPLYVQRKPLPLMGIHKLPLATPATRASERDIVKGSDAINFHDSLTIWGAVFDAEHRHFRQLFAQTLLKKIRGFRSSVHWPYQNTVCEYQDCPLGSSHDSWEGVSMSFCALAPACESLEDLSVQEPNPIMQVGADGKAVLALPQFVYSVPDDPSAQRDLLFGISPIIDVAAGPDSTGVYPFAETSQQQHLGQDDKSVPLTFYHMLTAIRFAQGNMPTNIRINSITLEHIAKSGTFTPSTAQLPGRWGSIGTEKVDYTLTTNHKPETFSGSANTYIDNHQVLFLMPHTLSAESRLKLSVQLDDEPRERILSCSLEGDVWHEGYTVTYVITISRVADDYYLFAEGQAETDAHPMVDDDGQPLSDATYRTEETKATTGSIGIHSYRKFFDYQNNDQGTPFYYREVSWQVTGFSTTGKEDTYTATVTATSDPKPTWLSSIDGWDNAKGVNVTDPSTLSFTFSTQASVYKNLSHDAALINNKVRDGADLADRSTYGSTGYESANCYIVNAQGSYLFPAVYGHAAQEAWPSKKAAADERMVNELNPDGLFKDHRGNPITHASVHDQTASTEEEVLSTEDLSSGGKRCRIKQTTCDNDSYEAQLLWKDTKNKLVNDVEYLKNPTDQIKFTLQDNITDNITPCNFVIALTATETTKEVTRTYDSEGNVLSTVDVDGTQSSTEGVILWTWHLWVTDEVYPNSYTVDRNVGYGDTKEDNQVIDLAYPSYHKGTDGKGTKLPRLASGSDIMPVPLGWVPYDVTWNCYEPRDVWVELTQTADNGQPIQKADGTNNVIHVKLRQEACPDLPEGWFTIYQWGRPTALPGVLSADNSRIHTIYDNTGNDITEHFKVWPGTTASTALTTAIKNPYVLLGTIKDDSWFPTPAPYWSESAKTLYDPCPPGFRLPSASVFIGSFAQGGTTKAPLNMYPTWGHQHQGAYLYTEAHPLHFDYTAAGFDRYSMWPNDYKSPVVYVPATGQWQAHFDGINNEESARLTYLGKGEDDDHSRIQRTRGLFWTGHYTDGATSGQIIFIYPDSYRADGFQVQDNTHFSTAMPIIPVAY